MYKRQVDVPVVPAARLKGDMVNANLCGGQGGQIAFSAEISVSYTHLDVYKRQGQARPHRVRGCGKRHGSLAERVLCGLHRGQLLIIK